MLERHRILRDGVELIPTDYNFCCDGPKWVQRTGVPFNGLVMLKHNGLRGLCPKCFEAVCRWHDVYRPLLMTSLDTWSKEKDNVPNL